MKLTIFTPTYNRAYLLPQLFESLQRQNKKGFEWLIVDDGSTDNTRELINDLANQADFKIHYYYQENQGKHVAINTALQHIDTPYFATVDSDDYLEDNAVEIIFSKLSLIDHSKNIVALASPIKILNKDIQGKIITVNTVSTTYEMIYKHKIHGEATLIFKTELARRFEYPTFSGEIFMLESVVFNRMDEMYKFLYIPESLVNAEYIPDGLTSQGRKKLLDNPKGAALAYKEKMNNSKIPLENRKIFAKNYWDYENMTNKSFTSKIIKIKGVMIKFYMIAFFLKRLFSK
ncbi:glycosyltransferase family 2 protein [Chryseobacterium chendengshani]|uniref:glycosyltransferase family 2 protein n=1 Tax=unclassified Chryseobacterium TaxID=2593645 RepID=UPI001C63CFF9|nr:MULTISPECIES: glycosyltransferase family 2 protein [unclassified Chryseobacterium]MBW7675609.1 glycosyltransferase family 2 protein [Chryseobacterium sp. LJ756]MBW8521828.1 glycosyltransferase family 2 protein [Chryseobacterium sp. LJ668]QYK17488.1 glycosyltransferase family 2 protein [Chryseobacterium sp. LJ668]